jgi:hypothetical protein
MVDPFDFNFFTEPPTFLYYGFGILLMPNPTEVMLD